MTGTPPAVGPVAGEIAVIDGGSYEKSKTLDVCPATVTPTGTLVPSPAGSVTTIAVCDHELTAAAGSACPANVTVPLVPKFAPSIVTGTPPAVGPVTGEIAVIDGGSYEKSKTLDVCPATVTPTGTLVPSPAGSVTTIAVCDHELTAAAGSACPANVTVPLVPKFAPSIVTGTPPAVGPVAGEIAVIDGGSYEKSKTLDVCPATVTPTGTLVPSPAGSVTTIAVCDHELTAAAGSACPANVTVPLVPKFAARRS